MFSYYGSKSKIVDRYPSPKYDRIIEPFAGSARYSLKYYWNDILLVDKYDVIVRVWKYLQQAQPKDILSLPDVANGRELTLIDGFSELSQEAKWLIGFCVGRGAVGPRNKAGYFNNWSQDKKRIASDLDKIKHWKIKHGDYLNIENKDATWFIDPPYQNGGQYYKHSNIDYKELAEWCKTRRGHVIVCENTKASWMDFYPMTKMTGAQHTTIEAIWSNMPHDYMARQETLL